MTRPRPDRYGETDPPEGEHPPCPNNGMSEDDQGRVKVCVICRPHLTPDERDKRKWGYGGPPKPLPEEDA